MTRYLLVMATIDFWHPTGDLYVLKTVLCDWDDERAAQILDNCRRAAAPETRLLIVDLVIPPDHRPSRLYGGSEVRCPARRPRCGNPAPRRPVHAR
ncbi:MAG TPA: methyltransferase [Actinomycetota bacterium]|jgi:hypothetical protein|nr:methyltransferase [Actinomycetota bacterium]